MPSTEQLDQSASARTLERDSIPNLDLRGLLSDDDAARSMLLEQVRSACLETGFFYVHNTCVADDVVQKALAATRTFFALADDSPIKLAVHNEQVSGLKGWTPIFGEPAYQKDTVSPHGFEAVSTPARLHQRDRNSYPSRPKSSKQRVDERCDSGALREND